MPLNDMISLKQYAGLHGGHAGYGSLFQLFQVSEDEMKKALTAGYQHPPTDGGNVMRVQSLESTMRITTFTQEHIKFWRRLVRSPAFNTVLEYNLQTSYGHTRATAWTREGETPQAQDASYQRQVRQVKYLGTQREVTHQATLIKNAHGDPITIETANGAIYLLHQIEMALWRGDSTVVPESFDGIHAQIYADAISRVKCVTDLRGGVLKPDHIEQAAQQIGQTFGIPTELHLAPKAHSDLSQQIYNLYRAVLPEGAERNQTLGGVVDKIRTTAGAIPLESNVFLRSGDPGSNEKLAPSAASSTRAPNAPTIVATANAGPIAGSKFIASDAGTWRYVVLAKNRFGVSGKSAASAAVIVNAGDAITIAITDGGGADPATGYVIFRTPVVNGVDGTQEEMVEVTRVSPTAPVTSFRDLNEDLPGTSKAFLLNMNQNIVGWSQLAPMMKIALATTGPAIRWMQLIYGTLILYQPQKVWEFKNIRDN